MDSGQGICQSVVSTRVTQHYGSHKASQWAQVQCLGRKFVFSFFHLHLSHQKYLVNILYVFEMQYSKGCVHQTVQSHVMAGLGFFKEGIKQSCSFVLIVITCSVAVGSGDKVLPTLLTFLATLTLALVAVVCVI